MAHIQDRWFKEIEGPDGKIIRIKTELYGKGMRYRARYIDPSGKERGKSFGDKKKKDAEDFLISVEHSKREHTYVSVSDGSIGFADYARHWLRLRKIGPLTRERHATRIECHLVPFFGNGALNTIHPDRINEWFLWGTTRYADDTRAVTFKILKSILASAVENRRIRLNPCSVKSVMVNAPRQQQKKIVPWSRRQVLGVRVNLPGRYKAMVDIAAGCGLRQGEILGLSLDDFDFERGVLHVRRQVKRIGSTLVFALPKNGKTRGVPLPASVAKTVLAHDVSYPAAKVELPWEDPASTELVTVGLLFANLRGNALVGCTFSRDHWGKALEVVGIPRTRDNGMHALRHYYASVLIDAGESIKVVSANLGHRDPAFTWRTYVHLIRGSEDRTRMAIDRLALADEEPDTAQGRPE